MRHLHDVSRKEQSGSRMLARHLNEQRRKIADALAVDCGMSSGSSSLQIMLRTLVSSLAEAIEGNDPEVVLHWARLTRTAHSSETILEAVAAACTHAGFAAERFHVDSGTLLVFLEIVQARLAEVLQGGEPRGDDRPLIDAVLAMLRARDEATCTHSYATGVWCRRLCEGLALSSATTERIVKAGVLHDVGKIGTPDEILFKPGRLTREEWAVMERHAPFGAEILSEIPGLAQYAPIVRSHHERIDGRGYPDGLAGDDIPFESRVVAVADALHAMIADRPYRKALSYGEAMDILRDGRGTQWEADVVDVMIPIVAAQRSRAVDADLAASEPSHEHAAVPAKATLAAG